MTGSVGAFRSARTSRQNQAGSAVVMTLLACLGVALCVQVLSVVVICGVNALREESVGRELLADRDRGLGVLRSVALSSWVSTAWSDVGTDGHGVEGRLNELEASLGWVLEAEVRQEPALTSVTTSAWVERGRDGLDLPEAAVVATLISAWSERVTPWLLGDTDGSPSQSSSTMPGAIGYVGRYEGPVLVEEGCELKGLVQPWSLDGGWRTFLASERSFGEDVWVLHGLKGQMLGLPEGLNAAGPSCPFLLIVTGGADLDARWRTELSGVIVVDGGSVLLDGTRVRGAVFVTDDVDVGLTGQVTLCRAVLRWATDVSLRRDRLAPGTRTEGTQ